MSKSQASVKSDGGKKVFTGRMCGYDAISLQIPY